MEGDDLDSMVGGCMGMVQEHVSLKSHPITSLSPSQKPLGISKVYFGTNGLVVIAASFFPPMGHIAVYK